MKTANLMMRVTLGVLLTAWIIGCQKDEGPVASVPAEQKQSVDKEPPGVHFLPFATIAPDSKDMSVAAWPSTETGWESKLCNSKTNTWVGSDAATYGNKVKVWHDCLANWDTMTVTVQVVDNKTFGAVAFFPSIPHFKHYPKICLCYAHYGISQKDAKRLKVYWWDPAKQVWAVIDNNPTVDDQYVKFTVSHFSMYAFAR